ncbi:RNA polymerase sigma factor [Streptomyces sp. NPDC058674]|uniref:RNA polymerase sigma factor n=1 Tax=Streptomyces sp. NPDC058674 TaxID=3346592 RepID=UPI00365426CA
MSGGTGGGTGGVRAGATEPASAGGDGTAQDGRDPVDFDVFFTAHRPALPTRAVMLCGSRQDAEDAVQDAFLTALENWDRVSTYDQPNAWVSLVMRRNPPHRHRQRLRRRTQQASGSGRRPPHPGPGHAPAPGAHQGRAARGPVS